MTSRRSDWPEDFPVAVRKMHEQGHRVIPRLVGKGAPFKWGRYKDGDPPTKSDLIRWHKKWPDLLWAIITGLDVIVCEFDGEEGLATMDRLGLRPHITSPSGGGHVYVEAPPGRKVRGSPRVDPGRFPGMDLLAFGQTATFYGRRPDGRYRRARGGLRRFYKFDELPPDLRRLIKGRQFKKRDLQPPKLPEGFGDYVAIPELLGEALRRSVAEGRNNIGFVLARDLRDEGLSRSEVLQVMLKQYQPILENAANSKPPYTPNEAYANVVSAFSQPPRLPRRAFLREDVVRMESVQLEPIEWHWEPWLPKGMISLLDGGKGRLKSAIAYSVAADLSTGRVVPGGKKTRPPVGVIIIQNEEHLEKTVKAKLLAAGADLRLVWVIPSRHDPATGRPAAISFPEDLGFIEDKIRDFQAETGVPVGLVTIDPIMGYLSENIHYGNDPQVRKAMIPLADTAQRFGVSFLLLRHLNKSINLDAEHRGGGSVAFPAAARVHMLVEWNPENQSQGVLACVNSNLTLKPRSLTYRSIETTVKDGPVKVNTYRVQWGDPVDLKADDLLRKKDHRKSAPRRDELVAWLTALLSEGDLPQAKVKKEFKAAGYTGWSYLEKEVAGNLGIVRTRVYQKTGPKKGKLKYWKWSLPRSAAHGVKYEVS